MQKARNLKKLVCLLCVFASLVFLDHSIWAQDFPSKPINIIVPSAVGGQAEITVRNLAPFSEEVFGQPLMIQAKPGGGGAVGTELVYGAKPDGYTLSVFKSNWNSILPAIEGRSRGPGEMEPVCRINTSYTFFFVQEESPFKTMKDMIDYAKANPGQLSHGNSGVWSQVDLEWRWLEMKAGIKTRNVNYTGGGQSILALLGGHIQVASFSPGAGIPHVRAGKLRPLAFSGRQRHPDFASVPTMVELGYDTGLDGNAQGILAPKGTPRPIIEKLAAGFKKLTEKPQAMEAFKKIGEEYSYRGPEEFAQQWRKDYEIFKEMGKNFKK